MNRPAKLRVLRRLNREGLLNDRAFSEAKSVLLPASRWLSWARQVLLIFGSTLVLAGVIFFFAYNWDAMGRFLKFGVIEAGIVGCILASHLRGGGLSGKVLLLSASVLTGVLLAVYGQTYQTGADAFELFLGWALLILGWVVISEFAALWLLWLILLNTAVYFYWKQVGLPARHISYEALCLGITLFNGAALFLWEFFVGRGRRWLKGEWFRVIILAGTLIPVTIVFLDLILDSHSTNWVEITASLAWVALAGAGFYYYRFRIRDMIPIGVIFMNGSVILLTFLGRVLFHGYRFHSSGQLLLFGIIILFVVSAAAYLLRSMAKKMAGEKEGIGR